MRGALAWLMRGNLLRTYRARVRKNVAIALKSLATKVGDGIVSDEDNESNAEKNYLVLTKQQRWGFIEEQDGNGVFVEIPKLPLIRAGYRQPPFDVTLANGVVRRIIRQDETKEEGE